MSYYHKGRADAAKREYNPPHGIMSELTTWDKAGMKRNSRENQEYREGYHDKKNEMKKKRN